MRTTLLLAALCCATPLSAQASFTPFGTGCTFERQTLAIGNRGLPQIGTTFSVTYSGPNFTFTSAQQIAHPWLILGLRQITLPVPAVFRRQPAGCFLFTTPDVVAPMPPDPNQAVWASQADLAVPNDPSLIGALFYAQWMLIFEQCGFAGCGVEAVPTSDAARVVIGP